MQRVWPISRREMAVYILCNVSTYLIPTQPSLSLKDSGPCGDRLETKAGAAPSGQLPFKDYQLQWFENVDNSFGLHLHHTQHPKCRMFSDLEYHLYHLRRPRHYSDESSTGEMSTTTSPSGTVPSSPVNASSFASSPAFTSVTRNGVGYSTLTTAIPVTTITQGGTTLTSFSQSISTQTLSTYPQSMSTSASAAFATSSVGTLPLSTCPGKGIDAAAAGIIASIILPTAIGLILWVSVPPQYYNHSQDEVSVAHFCNRTTAFSTNICFTRMVCSP
jgi:hypothetical protein